MRFDTQVINLCDALYENDGEMLHSEAVQRFGEAAINRAYDLGRISMEGEGRLTTVYLIVDQDEWKG